MIMRTAGIVSIAGVVSMVVITASACGGSDSTVSQGGRAGSEGGPCPTNGGTCDVGLVCLSKTCVKPADGDGGSTSSSSSSGSSGTTDGSAGEAASDFDAAACKYQHPVLDAGLRYCAPGHCYCKKADSCYPKAIAAPCCEGDEGTCY